MDIINNIDLLQNTIHIKDNKISNNDDLLHISFHVTGIYSLIISSSIGFVEEREEMDSIELSENVIIDKNTTIFIPSKKEAYRPRYIEFDKKQGCYIIHRDKVTISSMFILPLFFKHSELRPILPTLLNLYSFMEDRLEEEYYYLVSKFDASPTYLMYENRISNSINCQYTIDIDNYFIAFVLKIPDEFAEDAEYIKLGKYSSISSKAKKRIYEYYRNLLPVGIDITKTKVYKVLEKDEKYRMQLEEEYNATIPDDVDLYEMFSDIRETYLTSMRCL